MSIKSLSFRIYREGELVDTKTLAQEVIKVGKLKSSHICLDDPAVARMHAVIERSGDEVRVIDLGSEAGTSVGGERIGKNAALRDGDALTFGAYRIELEFIEGVAPAIEVAQAPASAPGLSGAPRVDRRSSLGSRAPSRIDAKDFEVLDGTRVAEVVAMYGSTVLDVTHVGQIKDKKSRAPMWLALGGLLVLGGAGVFGYEASRPWDQYKEQVIAASATGGVMPQKPGMGLGGVGLGLAMLGLVPLMLGVVRLGDGASRSYTIGEGHGASFHVPTEGLPSPAGFSLVRGSDHEFSLGFTEEMTGEVMFDGQTFALDELVRSGRAGASGEAYSFPIPPGANCRVAYRDMTFYVNSVAPGAVIAGASEADKPFWLYNGGSMALIGGLLVLSQLIPPDEAALGGDDMGEENRFVGYLNQPETPPVEDEPPPEEQEDSDDDAGGQGQRHKAADGKMGKPSSKQKSGLYAIKGPKSAIAKMARNFDPEMAARQAGILGVMQADSGHFLASPFGAAYPVGNDDADVWGGLTGTEVGEAYGVGGLGLVGTGRGSGGTGEGTIGYGNTGLIGKGGGGGSGSGYGRGSGAGFRNRSTRTPTIRQPKATVHGGLDKDIIRRVVRAHINEVRHCYNVGLGKDPNIKGRVVVQFTIGGAGKVPTAVVASTTVKDRSVGNCMAKSVRRWKFPKPRHGGSVIVSYPFVLNPG